MRKIYEILSLTIDITSITSIDSNIINKDLHYYIKINGQEHRIFSLSEHEKYKEYLELDNKSFSLHVKREKTESDCELMDLYVKMMWEIKKPISEMVKIEVEKLIKYWTLYNDGIG